jgi:hypothetical protein
VDGVEGYLFYKEKKMTLTKTLDDVKRDNRLVILSPAVVSVKRLKATNPSYVQLGPTFGGVEISTAADVEYFGDDATVGPIGGLVTGENVSLRFSLSQAGIYNLATAINYNDEDNIEITQPVADPPDDGVVLLQAGGKRNLEQYEIKIQVSLDSGKKIREYIFFKAVPDVDFMHRYVDKSRTLCECRFRVLVDTSKPEGKRYFSVTDYLDSDHGTIEAPLY